MARISSIYLATAAGLALCAPAGAATLTGVGEYDGVAGIGVANGDVTTPPVGTNYIYVTTAGSDGTAGYYLGDETNGSQLTTNAFLANANSILQYYFNYVTSDGSGFADYAYVTLNNLDAGTSINLFNARTTTSGNTVPGFGLPAIDPNTTLTPTSTQIVAGAPAWTQLGGSSGACYNSGCGYTGWIGADYTILDEGNYSFTFGVTNWDDKLFDSGLAIAGLTIDGGEIIDPGVVPVPAAGLLLLGGLGALTSLRRRKKS